MLTLLIPGGRAFSLDLEGYWHHEDGEAENRVCNAGYGESGGVWSLTFAAPAGGALL